LDMSRIVSGKLRLDVQPVSLAEVIEQAVFSVQPMADGREVRLTTVLDPYAGPISGDPARLQQVLWNLLTNGIKFTPKGGKVQVVLERVNSHIEVSVMDTGEGISPEFLPHIFGRFQQADASTTRRHGGLGLGLSIVKQLIELHGGSVTVRSAGKGQGSTFTLALPLTAARQDAGLTHDDARHHPASARGEQAAVIQPDLSGVSVLVVDDDPDAREIMRNIVSRSGAKVLTAESAATGLAALRSLRPTVLISDIGMPVEDGYDLIRRVRELSVDEGGKTPAVALTAFARSADRQRALLAGYQMHLSKPVEPRELLAVCASLAGRLSPRD
jgi:CheY-like chemotaxis protein